MAGEGAVAVSVRIRPLCNREEELGETTHVYWKADNNAIYQIDGSKSFNFDRVFHSDETTKNVYDEIAVPIIESAIQGYNGTIFAYGQTASGKTHTMMGSEDCLGVIPRAIHDIFNKIKKFPEREFLLRVSYMEIYNETITDLLCNTEKMKPLIIREDINRNVYVADLTEEVVYTSEMALQWISKGEQSRHYGITKMNQRSSRSHTIFRMILESREKGDSANCDGSIKVSHLNLVDLAGSERAAQTGAEGMRFKEGCNINRSLFILGQVIKKLSDGQNGGFINYRDSKLTRILQNSLGGNAKTRIICTITSASFDETLTTLQFASTAKYMKNTPYVNEVSSDEALLKRYRKEIVDLKKQLEEVSIKTRAQEMEKDQLAQLLDEKDLLQKVQDEKIQNLKRMLVTSSSLASQQELKAKKKRRVTWCLGKINKMKDSTDVDEFKIPSNVTRRSRNTSVAIFGESDESLSVEPDVFSNTFEPLTEGEWSSATKLLSQENLESELSSLHAKYDNLVLDNEQLRRENEELELKLKEKTDLDEFEALERQAEKDREMQLIHEIDNLKGLIQNAEAHNQDLENELSSKVELLTEKEEHIKYLQKHINSQKSEDTRMSLSFSSEITEDLKQTKQTLLDTNTVLLYANKELAFLRSENLELKEKIKELSNSCKQMEKDIQLYQNQLEAEKKIQVDINKELQSAFNEIAKLTSLLDGKVPKDLLCNLELEGRIVDLQRELNKEAKENESLKKEVNLLSELKSLPSEVEMLKKEIHKKSEELTIITSEKEKLFSAIAHKDKTIQSFLEEMGKAKDDLAASQLNYKSIDEEFQDFKTLHIEFKEKYKIVLEENERMKQEIENLSKESEIPDLSLDSLKTELSQKTQELQQKTTESQERVKEVEQLKEQLENRDSRLRTVEKEKTLITEKLHQTLEEVHALKQEKDGLKQLQESLQIERDQLKSDIQDTVNMNIDTQEQLFNALETLKQHEKTINTLNRKISEEASKNLQTADAKGELQQAVGGTDEQKWETKSTQTLIMDVKDNEVTEDQKKISTLMQENNELQQSLERITAVKEQLTTDLNDSIEMDFEYQELVRSLEDKLDKQQAVTAQEKNHATKKDEELSWTRERLAEAEANLKEKIQEARDDERSLNTGEKGGETPERRRKQGLKALYKARHSAPPRVDVEMPKLPRSPGEMTSKKKDDLQQLPQVLQSKQDQLPEHIRETTAKQVEAEEELKVARCSLKDQEETINKLKVNLSEKEYEISVFKVQLESASDELQRKTQELYEKQEELKRMQMHELDEIMNELEQKKELLIVRDSVLQNVESDRIKLNERLEKSQEEIRSLTKEKDELKGMLEALQMERDQQKESMEEIVAELRELQEKERNRPNSEAVTDAPENTEFLKQQLEAEKSALESMKMQNVSLTERLSENLEAMRSVRKERDDLRSTEECLKAERDQLKENLQQAITNDLKKEEELRVAHLHLKEHQETIDKLRVVVCEKTVEMSAMQGDLEQANASMKAQDLKKEEELRIAHLHLKECQETIDKLRRVVSEKTDEMSDMQRELEQANASIKAQFQELEEKEQQLNEAKEDLMETMCQVEHFKKQLEAQNSVLECSEAEKLRLTQELQKNLEEMKMINEENFILKDVEETLTAENEQLKESLRETEANDLKRQEELRTARVDLKEHQENIDKLREIVSQKTNEISNMKMDLENSNASLQEKIQKLKANKLQLLKLKGEISETQKQLKEQSITLSNIEMENLNLSQKLHENLEEMKSLIAERDNLRKAEEKLKVERDQLKENLQEMTARDLETQEELNTAHLHLKEQQENIDELREKLAEKTTQTSDIQKDLDKSDKELRKKDHQTHREVKPKRKLLYDGEHLPESLRGKCLRIKGLLERYSEMDNEYECLDRLYLDLEKEIEIQKELSIRVKENLLVPSPQAKQIEKLLTANQKCSMEFHRVVKKFKYVLSNITKIKEEEHDSINRLQLALVDEVEKQNELEIKIQCLELDCEEPSRELKNLNLNQNIDLHIEEILKDFSENDFPSIKTEFQQVLKNRKEMSQFLEEWLSSPFDTEKLKQVIQKANSNMCRVNNFYNDKINATVNESTEFEERIAMISKNWERDLKDMRDKTKQLFKDYQSLAVSQSSAHICPTTQSCKKTCIASGDKQRTARKIQELETSLHEAKESAIHKEDLIVKMQKKLEMTNEIIAKLQTKINDSNKCLEKSKETIEILQDKVALGAQPYKEEIEDLKMKLVKVDLEKMKNDKEHEKEIHSTKSIIENQKEMIRILRENLRRNLQDQDTSMVSEHNDLQPSNRPLTCGGGSGIIQSTKALILKSEYVRLEKEMSKLKKQNEQLMKQQSELLSENHHLSNEAKTWKEKIVKKEATCENSPKTPKVTGTGTRKKENTPRHRKQNLKDPVPKESPKSCFFDSRSKSLPVPHPVRYFDNSSLGLFPEEQTAEANSVDAKSGQLATSSEKDMVDCKMQ